MLLKKLNIILFYFVIGNAFGLNNSEINDAIKKYLKQNNIIQSFSINKKLKLPNCKKNIEVEKRSETYKTLKIICPQDNPWTYNVRIKIQHMKKKPTKKRKLKNKEISIIKVNKNLKKNQIITENDIYLIKTNKKGASNHFSYKEEVLGRKIKVSLREGQILRDRHIEKNWTIQEGQKIIIENNRSKIQILIEGIALNSAMKGDYVEVLNKSTGKPIKAWVKNNKKVAIFR
jgi:flagella basal body P-ring formation protein FlgA